MSEEMMTCLEYNFGSLTNNFRENEQASKQIPIQMLRSQNINISNNTLNPILLLHLVT